MARTISGKGGIQAEVNITDGVTPVIVTVQHHFKPALAAMMKQIGVKIKKAVAESFIEAQAKYQNHPFTSAMKGGKPALQDTGRLRESVVNYSPDDIDVTHTGDAYKVSVKWEFPESGGSPFFPSYRQDQNFVYLSVQEYGNRSSMKKMAMPRGAGAVTIFNKEWTLTPRPFFEDGVRKGLEEAKVVAQTRFAPMINMDGIGSMIWTEQLGMQVTPNMLPGTVLSTAMYVVPPSKLYMYVGAASDFMGVWAGSFDEATTLGYIRQMLWGRVGVTKKTSRRTIRGGLWS